MDGYVKFYIVCKEEGRLQATHRHTTLLSAQREAERLCSDLGGTFLVFQCSGAVHRAKPPVEWLAMLDAQVPVLETRDSGQPDDDGELPF